MNPTNHRPVSILGAVILAPVLAGVCAALDPDPEVERLVREIRRESLLAHVETLVSFGTRRADQPGGRAAQEYIETFLAGLDMDEVYLQDFDSRTDNVVAVLRGRSRPDRLHIIGAHYDSISSQGPTAAAPGADDNASGTAALLEAARVLSESALRPEETIVVVAFSGEELGLRGSRAFVEKLRDEGASVSGMICMDVIGYLRPGTTADLSVSSSTITAEIDEVIETLGEVAALYLPDWPFEGGAGCG